MDENLVRIGDLDQAGAVVAVLPTRAALRGAAQRARGRLVVTLRRRRLRRVARPAARLGFERGDAIDQHHQLAREAAIWASLTATNASS